MGVKAVKIDRIVWRLHALRLGVEDDLEDIAQRGDDLLRLAADGDAAVGALRGAGLVDFDVGAGVLADLLDLETGAADDPADDALVDEEANLLVLGVLRHEGDRLLEDVADDVRGVGLDGHDALGAGAIGDADVCIELGAQLLDVLSSLADNATGGLGGDDQSDFEAVSTVALDGVRGGRPGAGATLIITALHRVGLLLMGQIESTLFHSLYRTTNQ